MRVEIYENYWHIFVCAYNSKTVFLPHNLYIFSQLSLDLPKNDFVCLELSDIPIYLSHLNEEKNGSPQ